MIGTGASVESGGVGQKWCTRLVLPNTLEELPIYFGIQEFNNFPLHTPWPYPDIICTRTGQQPKCPAPQAHTKMRNSATKGSQRDPNQTMRLCNARSAGANCALRDDKGYSMCGYGVGIGDRALSVLAVCCFGARHMTFGGHMCADSQALLNRMPGLGGQRRLPPQKP